MGTYDRVRIHHMDFRCSEHHDLCGQEFQTKDLGRTMGDVTVDAGLLRHDSGGWGEKEASQRIWMCGDCPKCPAFVLPFSAVDRRYLQIVLHLNEQSHVARIEDVSESLAEWIALPYHANADGPHDPEVADALFRKRCAEMRAARSRAAD